MISTRAGEASYPSSPSSSSSSFYSRFRYDVFLSFRGLDTRKTFTGHLYTALNQVGFHTFLDDEELEYGENIEIELDKAITESKISLVVLSENYASSRWCLNELVNILQRKNASGYSVVPIFYHVKPTDIRHLSGNFGKAFQMLGGKLKKKKEDKQKLEEWRVALQEVANFRGMDLEKYANGTESKFIQQIVQLVGEKVGHKMLANDSYLVGINYRAQDIDSWLQDETTNVHTMIICGMGGIGKTTIAKFLYNKNFLKFQGSSFLENVRETLRESQGLHRLQEQLFLDILKNGKKRVHNNSRAISELQNGLGCKKILIVFDAVDEQDQLDKILGQRNWPLRGSKIIITTRNKNLLSPLEIHMVTIIEALSPDESLELFSWHAFGGTHPSTSFNHVSQIAVDYCQGHPLAIKILASLFHEHGNHLDKWIDELSKLKESPDERIFKILKTSYESLGEHERNLFLHIACLFVGKKTDKVSMTLSRIGFHAKAGIDILTNRCMLEAHHHLQMHQLLQEMGRHIVCQISSNKLGHHCILWNHDDSFNVLREKTGTCNIKSIVLDGSQLKHSYALTSSCTNKKSLFQKLLQWSSKLGLEDCHCHAMGNLNIVFETDAFAKMHSLNFLKLKHVQLRGSYENFPKRLRYLKWHRSLLQSIPSDFAMESLVVLNMKYSSLKYLWDGSKNLSSLEILNLRDSHTLRVTPDFSMVPKLKQLILENCTSLVEFHESIWKLKDLVLLNLKNCKNLSKLPGTIGILNSLDTLDVSGCSRLEGLPLELGNMKTLQVLFANRIGEEKSTKQKAHMCNWILKPQRIPKITLASLPQSLTELNLEGCNLSDEDFSSNLNILFSLVYVNLDNNMISKSPDFIKSLPKLRTLSLESCPKLQYATITNLEDLYVNNCTVLRRITSPYGNRFANVEHEGCRDLVEVEGAFKLEPAQNVDVEILSNLGLYKWGNLQFTNVKLRKLYDEKARKFPLQVYSTIGRFCIIKRYSETGYTDGGGSIFDMDRLNVQSDEYSEAINQKQSWNIFCTWVPRIKVSCWFNNYLESKSTFTMPSYENTTMTQGLTVRLVYDIDNIDYSGYVTYIDYLEVLNNSKRLSWVVYYNVKGIPETNQDMIWSTFLKMASHHVEGGDKLSIVVPYSYKYKVKEIGVRLLYKEHEHGPTLSTIEQSCTFGKYIPNNVDAYLRSHQNDQDKLKLNASGSSIRKAFGGFITSKRGMWVVGYYGNLDKIYQDTELRSHIWKTKLADDYSLESELDGHILDVELKDNYLEGEVEGIYNGLRLIKDQSCIEVEIETYSKAVFELINDVNSPHEQVITLPYKFSRRTLHHVSNIQVKFKHLYTVKYSSSEGNRFKVAARLAEMGYHIDPKEHFVILDEPPMEIKEILFTNMVEVSSNE